MRREGIAILTIPQLAPLPLDGKYNLPSRVLTPELKHSVKAADHHLVL